MANQRAANKAGFHRFPETGSFEVFWDDEDRSPHGGAARNYNSEGEPVEAGWYWWACSPGCLPDGDAIGPFPTSLAAFEDARNVD